MHNTFNVLILGGYGNFGQLIATALCQDPNISVIISGRNGQKAKKLAESLNCQYMQIDAMHDNLMTTFNSHNIHLVISTIGPFQNQSYHIAEAAIAANIHYIDLADSREFVENIVQFNNIAQEKSLFICSGASTVPSLSSAVVNHYMSEYSDLKSIDITLSASEKVPGISTLSAVLSYCGQKFIIWKDQQWQSVYGLQNLAHHQFYHLPNKRWVANCNVPDLALFPKNYPTVQQVTFKAGVGISLVQISSWAVSWLKRWQLMNHPIKYVDTFYKIAQYFERFGDGLSGMQIKLNGSDHNHKPLSINWEIIGYDNEGPNIPCFASIILARKLANQEIIQRGAFSSMNLITLDEYLEAFQNIHIKTFTDKN